MPTLTSINEALHISGLRTNYGTVADVPGRPGAARALANENWGQARGRIARADGMTESEDRERDQAWRDTHIDEMHVHTAFDYIVDKPWPQDWWVPLLQGGDRSSVSTCSDRSCQVLVT